MTELSPDLFDLRYDDLVQLGRSRLPALAPEWTDHNVHDPGITLIELLAWVAEAQLYSLGRRPRRDERMAYGALLGVSAAGTRAARGLLWADRSDAASPLNTFRHTLIIEPGAEVHLVDDEDLMFHPAYRTLLAPGKLISLSSRAADGSVRNFTSINERGGTVFLPFGETAGPRDVLTLEFETYADDGIFPSPSQDTSGAIWAIGIRVDEELQSYESTAVGNLQEQSWFAVTLIEGTNRFSLPIVSDTSRGMMRMGALMLDMSRVTGSPKHFVIEFRAPNGLPRAPRLLRIEPNVLPITQRSKKQDVEPVTTSQPDLSFDLTTQGLCFEPDEPPICVKISDGNTLETWTRWQRLSDQGPADKVYEFDETAERVLFGNGHNGCRPPVGSQVLMSYSVSDGEDGNIARNRKWNVSEIAGMFGTNLDPVSCGSARLDWTGLRRAARRHAREDHALVSSADIEAAAMSLPLLEVARAWVLPLQQSSPGTVTLVAMRRRPGDVEPAQPPEKPRWIEAVRRGLAGRMLLGTRLLVVAPRYVDFIIRANLLAERSKDPVQVEVKAREALMKQLALLPSDVTAKPREAGVPVTTRDVMAWLRGVNGVDDVRNVELVAGSNVTNEIAVPSDGLPRLDLNQSSIRIERAGKGRVG